MWFESSGLIKVARLYTLSCPSLRRLRAVTSNLALRIEFMFVIKSYGNEITSAGGREHLQVSEVFTPDYYS